MQCNSILVSRQPQPYIATGYSVSSFVLPPPVVKKCLSCVNVFRMDFFLCVWFWRERSVGEGKEGRKEVGVCLLLGLCMTECGEGDGW